MICKVWNVYFLCVMLSLYPGFVLCNWTAAIFFCFLPSIICGVTLPLLCVCVCGCVCVCEVCGMGLNTVVVAKSLV